MKFSRLKLKHENAIAEYIAEFTDAGESKIHGFFAESAWSHAETVKNFQDWAKYEHPELGVPCTTQFLIANDRILGNYNFRHELTEALLFHGGNCGYSVRPSERRKGYATMMLGHAINFGRSLGLPRMLVTCAVDNQGSERVIKNHGGEFYDVVYHQELKDKIARFWIKL